MFYYLELTNLWITRLSTRLVGVFALCENYAWGHFDDLELLDSTDSPSTRLVGNAFANKLSVILVLACLITHERRARTVIHHSVLTLGGLTQVSWTKNVIPARSHLAKMTAFTSLHAYCNMGKLIPQVSTHNRNCNNRTFCSMHIATSQTLLHGMGQGTLRQRSLHPQAWFVHGM